MKKIKVNMRALAICAGIGGSATALTIASAGTTGNAVNKLLGYVYAIFKYIGILLLAWGIGQMILAFKNEDADSKSRAMMIIVVAIILTTIGTIVAGLGIGGITASTASDI